MRKFKIGTIALRKTDEVRDSEHRIKERNERFSEAEPFIVQAGKEKVDFLCLPEYFSIHGIAEDFSTLSEEVPGGPTSQFCSRLAQKYKLNLITSIARRKDNEIYNTAVIFDRAGKLAGSYDKVHPAPGEQVTPGGSFPVYNVEGLKIGFQLCYDLNFPEGCRILALKGAEIIFWPTMWDNLSADIIPKARAMENFLVLVSSAYVFFGNGSWRVNRSLAPTEITSWSGLVLARTGLFPGLAVAEIDFDEQESMEETRASQFKNRRPEMYAALAERIPAT